MNYELYGLRIGSDLPLNAPTCGDDPVDLEVSWGQPLSATPAPPAGRVLAHAVWGGGQGYTHTETPQGYMLQFHEICELRVARDCKRIGIGIVRIGGIVLGPGKGRGVRGILQFALHGLDMSDIQRQSPQRSYRRLAKTFVNAKIGRVGMLLTERQREPAAL